jgi:hypothetical protein
MHWSGLPKISLHKMHTHVYIPFSRESDYSISPMITLSAFSYKNALRIKHRDNERVYFSSSKLCSAIKRSSYKTLRRDCLLKGQSLKFPTQVQRWQTQKQKRREGNNTLSAGFRFKIPALCCIRVCG